MKFSLVALIFVSSASMQISLAEHNNPSIRGVVKTKQHAHRTLKGDTGDSEDENSAGVTLPPDMQADGNFELLTNEETGQTFAIYRAPESGDGEDGDGANGLRETHGCVTHQDALDFIAGYTVQNVEHDEECLDGPNNCGGGCCRVGYQLTCDEENLYYHLPCMCNQNTRDPSAFTTAPYPGGVNVPGVPEIPEPGATPSATVPSPVPAGTGIPAVSAVPGSAAVSSPIPAPAPAAECITHDYALEIVDVLGGLDFSEPECLESPLPESCPGCCRVGATLACDVDGAGDDPRPCVCA